MVIAGFRKPLISILYIVSQLVLFMHLSHGIQSSFQTLGLKNRRFAMTTKMLGLALTAIIVLGNVAIVLAVQAGAVPSLYSQG
jgi:succinate dehydrogenase / fumarate reductase cytochrome b subunit